MSRLLELMNEAESKIPDYGASIGWGSQGLKSTATEGVRPEQINMVGKAIAGRMLDERFHDEFPRDTL